MARLAFSSNALYSSSSKRNISTYDYFASTTSIHLHAAAVAHIAVMSRQVDTFKSCWLLCHVWVIIRISRTERGGLANIFVWVVDTPTPVLFTTQPTVYLLAYNRLAISHWKVKCSRHVYGVSAALAYPLYMKTQESVI